MEELGKLVNLQSILSFLEERHLSSNNQDSDRFLAEFTMFMAKQCGNLTMEAKFSLISDYLPKISPAILEEAALCLTGEGVQLGHQQNCGDLPTEVYCESESNVDVMGGYVEDMAMVGLESMQRANSTLEDFCRFYFIFHEMDVKKPELVFKYLPMLSFTESYIYQLDSYNEQILSTTAGTTDAKKPERNHIMKDHLLKVIKNDPFGPLVSVLEDHGLMTERIRAELRSGEEYWLLERKLCNSLAAKQQVNDLHMEFLSVSEFLVEVSDDLFDYEDDVVENSFNILRMFVGIYGASKAPSMLAQCITEAEEKYVGLSKTLEENLSLNCWRRCEEATREGGKNSVHSFGTWHIPTVISDEGLYRLNNTQNRLDS
ncbi:uncharacterized protein LOC113331793 isoform X3 [Papaver somniferum]|uniref:uncharacterized protein LOC113331793 isoform X3 n=1 Tax=Papaver somniferum TaxID=3469 RepID=UPI000E6F7908|nr:uncharacterized protein LOC113331793 isoform X3 [Papaver somniferum]